MRLKEMHYLIHNALDNWVEPVFVEHKQPGTNDVAFSFENAQIIIRLIKPLSMIPVVRKNINKIYKTSSKFKTDATPYITGTGVKLIRECMNIIYADLSAMADMCMVLGVEQNSVGFDVKLPPNITLAELSECTKDLNHIFTQCPLLHSDNEEIKLHGVDIGSMWLTFTIICMGAATTFYVVNNLAAMVDKVLAIREHAEVLKQQEELTQRAGIKGEMLQTIVEANKTIIKTLTNDAVKELATEKDISTPEDVERTRASFIMLKEWMEKGMEVYSAIDAPDEVKAAFPPVEMQMLPDSTAKILEAHNDEKE